MYKPLSNGFWVDVNKHKSSLPIPYSIHLQVTTFCNLKCLHCFYKKPGQPKEIPFNILQDLIREWGSFGVRWLAIGGGEPFLYPQINDVIFECKKHRINVAITTNGTIKPKFNLFLPNRIAITDDGGEALDKKIFKFNIMGKVYVNKIFNNNIKDIEKIFGDYQVRYSIKFINLLLLKPIDPNLDYGNLVEFVEKHRRLLMDPCLAQYLSEIGLIKLLTPCMQGRSSMSIDVNLTVAKCSNIKEERVPYANLKETWDKIRITNKKWDQHIKLADCLNKEVNNERRGK